MEFAQPSIDQVVDEAGSGDRVCGRSGRFFVKRNQNFAGENSVEEPRGDDVAASPGRHGCAGTDFDGVVVFGLEDRPRGDVSGGAVAELGGRGELDGLSGRLQSERSGADPEFLERPRRVSAGSLVNPLAQKCRRVRVEVKPLATAVVQRLGRLQEDEAFVGVSEVDSAAFQVEGKRLVIEFRVASVKRKSKAASTGGRTVARSGVTAKPREERDDLRVKVDLGRSVRRQ